MNDTNDTRNTEQQQEQQESQQEVMYTNPEVSYRYSHMTKDRQPQGYDASVNRTEHVLKSKDDLVRARKAYLGRFAKSPLRYDRSYDILDGQYDLQTLAKMELSEEQRDQILYHSMREQRPWSPIDSPQDEDAVIGACLISPFACEQVMDYTDIYDFTSVECMAAWEVMEKMYKEGRPIDLLSFTTAAKEHGIWERIGGQPFFAQVLANVTSVSHALYHARLIRDRRIRRDLINAAYKIYDFAHDINLRTQGNSDPFNWQDGGDELQNAVEEEIKKAFDQKGMNTSLSSLKDLAAQAVEEAERKSKESQDSFSGVRSGFRDFDSVIDSFATGSLNIIAARPSMGKSALALNIALNAISCYTNFPHVIIFSLEMSELQIVNRMLSVKTGISLSKISKGQLSESDLSYLKGMQSILFNDYNISIKETPGLTPESLRAACKDYKRSHGNELDLVIVDYLQLMKTSSNYGAMRAYEIGEISRSLKTLAVELQCPIIALSQLSREIEKREDKTPRMSDLRDSGTIEQDADTITFLHRQSFYDDIDGDSDKPNKAELRVTKNRNGPIGKFNLLFMKELTRFVDTI